MFKLCIKFIFYPILIVIVGMYYLVSYLTVAIAAVVSGVVICKKGIGNSNN